MIYKHLPAFCTKVLIIIVSIIFTTGCNFDHSDKEKQITEECDFTNDSLLQPTGNTRIDSLKHIAATGTIDEKLSANYKLTFEYMATDKNLSINYANTLLRLAQKEKQKKWEGDTYTAMASTYFYGYQFDSAIYFMEKAINIFEYINDEYEIMLAKQSIAQILKKTFKFDESLKLFQECLDYFIKTEQPTEKARILQNIANLYYEMNLYDLSIDYYEQALEIFNSLVKNTNIWRDIGGCYNGIGNNLYLKKEYEKSLEYLEKALEIYRQINNSYFSAHVLSSLASRYLVLDKDDDFEKVIIELDDILKNLNNQYFLYYTSELKSEYNYKKKQYKKALDYAKEALSFINDSNKRNLESIYKNLTLASVHAGTPKETVEYVEKYIQLSKEIFDEERNSKVTEMEIKYETEKKELEINALKTEKHLLRFLTISVGVIFLLIITFLIILWRWTVQKRQIAEARVNQLEKEKQLIAFESILDGETKERIRLSRDLHDGLGSILAGVRLNFQEMKKGATMDYEALQCYDKGLGLLESSVREMRRVAHHLMPESLAVSGIKRATEDFILSIPHATFSYFGEELRFDRKFEEMLYRIMHELVSNAIKHSGAKTIHVEISHFDKLISLCVKDDGCGFDILGVKQGMGLKNIRSRVEAFSGNLQINSVQGEGTEVNVEFEI